MRKTIGVVLCTVVALSAAVVLLGQARKRISPHEKTSGMIGGTSITIEYGRPYKKGRQIFGGLEAFGKVWRTGADEATKLTTEDDVMIGSIHVPKGTYSLFTIPGEKEWTLVLNKVASQWGAFKYDQKSDLGRTPMKVETSPSTIEQLTIAIEPAGGRSGVLKVMWDTTTASAPIMVH